MDEQYLTPKDGTKWAISRFIKGRWISLHQDSYLFDQEDAPAVLGALNIPVTKENLDTYFPERRSVGRCPTLELMELCNILDPTNPHIKKEQQVGV